MAFDYSAGAPASEPVNGASNYFYAPARPPRPRYWLHILLLLLTLASTMATGSRIAENFRLNRPAFQVDRDLAAFLEVWSHPATLLQGLPFSLTLMIILLAHELGHYLACRYYQMDASLPYFIPAPTFIGTLGAFIRIRSPLLSRRILFDVGIAGPLAGFILLLPFLAIGLAFSKVLPGIAERGDLIFGTPPVLRLLEMLIFPGAPASDIYLHPVARAAWVGVFSTALNLLPIGQLDGGHILYSFLGEKHRLVSRLIAVGLIPLGFLWPGWWVWAVLLLIFGMRHPAVFDSARMSSGRRKLGLLALLIFALCFTPAPTSF